MLGRPGAPLRDAPDEGFPLAAAAAGLCCPDDPLDLVLQFFPPDPADEYPGGFLHALGLAGSPPRPGDGGGGGGGALGAAADDEWDACDISYGGGAMDDALEGFDVDMFFADRTPEHDSAGVAPSRVPSAGALGAFDAFAVAAPPLAAPVPVPVPVPPGYLHACGPGVRARAAPDVTVSHRAQAPAPALGPSSAALDAIASVAPPLTFPVPGDAVHAWAAPVVRVSNNLPPPPALRAHGPASAAAPLPAPLSNHAPPLPLRAHGPASAVAPLPAPLSNRAPPLALHAHGPASAVAPLPARLSSHAPPQPLHAHAPAAAMVPLPAPLSSHAPPLPLHSHAPAAAMAPLPAPLSNHAPPPALRAHGPGSAMAPLPARLSNHAPPLLPPHSPLPIMIPLPAPRSSSSGSISPTTSTSGTAAESPPPVFVPRKRRRTTARCRKQSWSLDFPLSAVPVAPPDDRRPSSSGGCDDDDNSANGGGSGVRRRRVVARQRNRQAQRVCSHCNSPKTPQWRTGPDGPGTLCNACGIRYAADKLLPEYRPSTAPSFQSGQHSNRHRKVVKIREQKANEELVSSAMAGSVAAAPMLLPKTEEFMDVCTYISTG